MHKSLRDSDGDAAIYWIGRMLAGGEDPRYIARRMINFASEDVYDQTAMILANATYDICEKMGMPECELPMMNTAYYLAGLPKDNRVYMAMQAMHKDVREYGNLPVPLHLRNAPTELMKEAGYGRGYEYAHDLKEKKSKQEHFPEELK
jgi:putative ATPase